MMKNEAKMTKDQKTISQKVWTVFIVSLILFFIMLIICGVCNYFQHTFLSSATIIALVSFITAILGMVTLIEKAEFNKNDQ